jgi:hypothetical protein
LGGAVFAVFISLQNRPQCLAQEAQAQFFSASFRKQIDLRKMRRAR